VVYPRGHLSLKLHPGKLLPGLPIGWCAVAACWRLCRRTWPASTWTPKRNAGSWPARASMTEQLTTGIFIGDASYLFVPDTPLMKAAWSCGLMSTTTRWI